MDNARKIALLKEEMDQVSCDARLESQLSQALGKGYESDDFLVSCDSLFHREYSRDVYYTEAKEDVRKLDILQIHLTRSGVADHLPEGLFFQPSLQPVVYGGALLMAEDHRINKRKEQAVRRFFLPIENDFFWQRLELEAEENRLLEGLRSGILNDYFLEFWRIPATIPAEYFIPLLMLLPYAHRIAGDLELTAQSLGQLIDEPVECSQLVTHDKMLGSAGQRLGEGRLATELVCGESFDAMDPVMQCTIGPLAHSEVSDYLEAGRCHELLKTFYGFFIPVGTDITTNIAVQAASTHLTLHPERAPVLGYSTALA